MTSPSTSSPRVLKWINKDLVTCAICNKILCNPRMTSCCSKVACLRCITDYNNIDFTYNDLECSLCGDPGISILLSDAFNEMVVDYYCGHNDEDASKAKDKWTWKNLSDTSDSDVSDRSGFGYDTDSVDEMDNIKDIH